MLLKGALIEYGANLVGPIPNAVIFQFNPETITRNVEIPPHPSGATSRENSQAGEIPVERINLVAQFTIQETLAARNPLSLAVGIGPQLAALEKMVRPSGVLTNLLNKAIDAVGDAVSGGGSSPPTQPVPRESYPRILFIWGLTRVLPVTIDSMSIAEKQYDRLLNPIQADVTLGLTVISPDPCASDIIADGAFKYTSAARDAMALANLANSVQQLAELVPF